MSWPLGSVNNNGKTPSFFRDDVDAMIVAITGCWLWWFLWLRRTHCLHTINQLCIIIFWCNLTPFSSGQHLPLQLWRGWVPSGRRRAAVTASHSDLWHKLIWFKHIGQMFVVSRFMLAPNTLNTHSFSLAPSLSFGSSLSSAHWIWCALAANPHTGDIGKKTHGCSEKLGTICM